MDVTQFDFDLPGDLIALRPSVPRDAARMLVVPPGEALKHAHVHDLPEYLRAGDMLVFNDTKVIPARLRGRRVSRAENGAGPKIEILLLARKGPSTFSAFARPARKVATGDRVALGASLSAEVVGRSEGGEVTLAFTLADAALDTAIAREGEVPLPPYIMAMRSADARDRLDYQTIFADREGSVAAPTAGLHFSPGLMDRLARAGVDHAFITLHVGAGTFLPVRAADTALHRMHGEWAELSETTAQRLNRVREAGGRIVAVGTTVMRTLESAVDEGGKIAPFRGETDIFLAPGHRFRTADVLLTNFHLPRSTLFMLVAAFSGLETMQAVYREAIKQRYRFYSYGDACLLFRRP